MYQLTLRARREAAGVDAQHEAERDEADVEERDLLQLEAVGDVLDEVERATAANA